MSDLTFSYFLLTSWSRVFLEKLTGFQLVKNFSAFYGTRRFVAAITNVQVILAVIKRKDDNRSTILLLAVTIYRHAFVFSVQGVGG